MATALNYFSRFRSFAIRTTGYYFIFVVICSLLAYSLLSFLLLKQVKAASLTTVAVALSDETVSGTGTVTLTFTPNTTITTGSILEISYDTAFTGGAALVDADVAVTGTNITSSVESGFAAGYFKSTLTTSAGVTTTVTVTIDNSPGLTNPASSGNYNWAVIADIGGTGTTYDSGAGLAYVANDNDVTVTATVGPVIDMELYQQNSDTELTDPNTCALGALSINTVKSCVYDIGFGTNNTTGVTVKVIADAVLDSGANTINDVADGTVTAGVEEYGFRITDAGTGCSTTASGTYGSQDNAVPTAVTTFFTNSTVCNGTTAGQSAKHVEITHRAAIDTSTATGSYDQLVTYTAFTN